LRAAHIQRLAALKLLVVELVDGLGCLVVVGKVDEPEAARLPIVVFHDEGRLNLAEGHKHALQAVVVDLERKRLDEHVGEGGVGGGACVRAILARHEEAHEDLLSVEKHAVHLCDGQVGGILCLIVHKAVPLGAAGVIGGYLAAENIAERGECIVQRLVVDGLVEVLDEDVARARLAQ